MLDINAGKRYERLFVERFQRRPNTYINKNNPESIISFINEIRREYDKVIHEINKKGDDAAANNYVNNERIRLIASGSEIDKRN